MTLEIAKGDPHCPVSPPPEVAALPSEMVVARLARLQADFPVIPLRLDQPDVYIHGVDGIRQFIEVNKEMLAALGEPVSTQTLHQALDAYSAYIGEKYQDKPSRRPLQGTISLLRSQAEDSTLEKLDADRIETWLAYWCRRPTGPRGRPLAPTTCRNALIGLRQFLRWLSRSRQFDWQMPGGFSFPRCNIAQGPAGPVRARKYFKPEELKTIWSYAHPWERALIVLALNCGFSKAEIATLHPAEIIQVGKHSFIKRHRRKTGAYAEWIL